MILPKLKIASNTFEMYYSLFIIIFLAYLFVFQPFTNKLTKLNAAFLLNVNNITNNPYYIHFTQNAFAENLSYYRLRPRQVVGSFVKKF